MIKLSNHSRIFYNIVFHLGAYEDAISTDYRFTFHYNFTIAKIGLITPKEIIDMTLDFIKESNIPLNSTEGF